ncbi:MAG: pyruvate dehydrogenase (acetyl-transferring) E1 component subunit alpha [Chloroflexi bacterium]|nr:pyruvate dehydrogenase (acetyl-transferring) E1 component subunit alpha [Chloroflexota bacterium]|tara:strand:- start:2094 stop:3065 length:972 start_codon:yes stop_codon:yes gene_type:complete
MDKSNLSKKELFNLLQKMILIREFEESCGENYAKGFIRGFLHLYIGEEAIAVGSISALREEDYVVTHYRDHGHALARDLDTNSVMAELFGKSTGVSKGKGGSMHLFDVKKHFMGGHAIVGAQLPLALGIALACKYKKENSVVLVFFGDGAVSQGTFHETLNLASLWELPVLFFLENNLYGMGSHVENTRAEGRDIHSSAESYGIHAEIVDGMNVLEVLDITKKSLDSIRNNSRPILIEAKTFRFSGHSMADPAKYRSQDELNYWLKRDPIESFEKYLVDENICTQDELKKIKDQVQDEISKAVEYAIKSPEPSLEDLKKDIYA